MFLMQCWMCEIGRVKRLVQDPLDVWAVLVVECSWKLSVDVGQDVECSGRLKCQPCDG